MYFHDRLVGAILWDSFFICKPWIYSPGTRMLTFQGLGNLYLYFQPLFVTRILGEQSPIGRSNWYVKPFFSKQKTTNLHFSARHQDWGAFCGSSPTHKPVTSDSPPSHKKKHMSHVPMARCCNLLMVSTQEQGITRAAGARDFGAPGSRNWWTNNGVQRGREVNNGNKNQPTGNIYRVPGYKYLYIQ